MAPWRALESCEKVATGSSGEPRMQLTRNKGGQAASPRHVARSQRTLGPSQHGTLRTSVASPTVPTDLYFSKSAGTSFPTLTQNVLLTLLLPPLLTSKRGVHHENNEVLSGL